MALRIKQLVSDEENIHFLLNEMVSYCDINEKSPLLMSVALIVMSQNIKVQQCNPQMHICTQIKRIYLVTSTVYYHYYYYYFIIVSVPQMFTNKYPYTHSANSDFRCLNCCCCLWRL